MANKVIEKHPDAEILFDDFDFTDELPDDSALDSVNSTVTAVDAAGSAAASVVGTVSRDGMSLRAVLQAGTNGQDYLVTFKAEGDTTEQVAIKQVEMRVRSKLTGSL
jgi:hypothetical protein